jgi:hypothetical protein
MSEQRKATTYHFLAQSMVDEERGGRYATEDNKQTVIGAAPISYPTQPSGSPWANEPSGVEPPIGYDINAQDPVGEIHEQARSTDGSNRSASTGTSHKARGWRRF